MSNDPRTDPRKVGQAIQKISIDGDDEEQLVFDPASGQLVVVSGRDGGVSDPDAVVAGGMVQEGFYA